ncbi:MAG: PAS domain S-box protein, partial [Anaerolineae bacterium]|nr:PAS domain S-box protein [Anaerolineae bacterium]
MRYEKANRTTRRTLETAGLVPEETPSPPAETARESGCPFPIVGTGSSPQIKVNRLLFDNHPVPMWIYDLETLAFLAVNEAAQENYGYSRDDLLKMTLKDICPRVHIPCRHENIKCKCLPPQHSDLWRHRLKDGTMIDVEITSHAIEYEGYQAALMMAQDVTERTRVQNILQARLRLLEFANSHSTDELLTATVDEIEALTGSQVGFYHFLEADQKTLSLQSWSTNTLNNMCIAEGKGSHYDIAQAGVWVDCIHKRRPVIHNDYASLPHRKGMPEGHAPVVREAVVPIFRGDLIRAIIGVGNKATDYSENDVEIVSQLGDLSWDIVERKQAEEALHRLNRELHAISNCNQALLRAVDEQILLNDICRIVCDEAGYRMAWVGYAENDEARTIRPVAWAGIENGYLEQVKLTWSDTERGRGPAGTAIRSGEITYAQDFTTDPRMAPWRESALQRGYRSSITLPLKDENAQVFGVLILYSAEVNAFTSDEIQLLEELAGDLAFGINTLRTRAERKRAEEALIETHSLLKQSARFTEALLSAIPTPVFYKDREGRYLGCNRAFSEIMGVTSEEMKGKTVFELWPSEHARTYHDKDLELMSNPARQIYEFTVRDQYGVDRPVIYAKDVFRDKNDRVAGTVGAFLDIAERKRAEEALRESERRYRTLFEDSPISLWEEDFSQVKAYLDDLRASGIADLRTYFENYPEAVRYCASLIRVLDVNKATLALVGVHTKDELLAPLSPVLAEESLPVFREELIVLAGKGQRFESEMIHRTIAGEIRFVVLQINAALGYENSLSKVLVSISDVTERKRAEEELERNREAALQFSAQLAALQEITNQLSKVESHDELSRRAVELGRSRLGFDRIGIWFVGERLGLAKGSFGTDERGELRDERGREVEFGPDDPDWQLLYRKESTVMVQNNLLYDHFRRQVGEGSRAVATLWDGNETIGLISVDNLLHHQPITEQQLELIRLYATTLGHLFKRKRIEEALREKTEELDRYFTNALDLLCIADTDGYFRRLNPEWESTLGFPISELEGRRFLDFVHPDDLEATLQAVSQLAEQKEVLNFANRYRCKDGAYRWIEWRSFPVETNIYAVARDITERKKAEMQILASEQLFRALVENSPDFIARYDREFSRVYVNPAIQKLFGRPVEDVLNQTPADQSPVYAPDVYIDQLR